MKHTTGRALTEGETWRAMAAMIGHWQLRRYGSYALEEKSSHEVIGVAGLDYPNDWPEPEIKWGLIRDFWGKGYASEAVRAIKKMWIEYLPELPLISLIHPNNTNSVNLAANLPLKCRPGRRFFTIERMSYFYNSRRLSLVRIAGSSKIKKESK